jgi:oxygen-independent coproporphyrinogen-3 oxidase
LAGIYIHIPYCTVKCPYCNFFSLASSRYRDILPDSFVTELGLRKHYLADRIIDTIYFGGGTPSLMTPGTFSRIIDEINRFFPVSEQPEITLEANPEDLSAEYIGHLAQTSVNRISIGVQSFRDEDLAYLGRIHSAERAITAIRDLKSAGFGNITLDLIYGIPTLSDPGWQENLDIAVSLDIQHISAYALTVEEKTPLAWQIQKKKVVSVSDEDISRHWQILCTTMRKAGYDHYEISNFCRPDFISRHNSNYWKGEHYLGIGPSAHSYDGTSRSWNISNISTYIDSIDRKELPCQKEVLTEVQRYNEYVMTGLRTKWGIERGKLWKKEEGRGKKEEWDERYIVERDGIIRLTEEGMLFADRIILDFMTDMP